MNKVLSFKSSQDHYTAKATIVWCLDARFSNLYQAFCASNNWKPEDVDLIRVAGGAKDLASPEKLAFQEYALDQITKSLRLHHAPVVILTMHCDCGAYGKKFKEAVEERAFFNGELEKATSVVRKQINKSFPETNIVGYFADFNGLLILSE